MPLPPFTITDPYTGVNKLFGGQIVQVPVADGGPNTNLQYKWIMQNWSSVYPNWILPQMKNWKRRGGTTIALIAGLDGVMDSTYTYSTWKTNLTQMLADIRSLGLTFHYDAFETGSYGAVGSFTAAQWFAPTASLLTDLLIPNQDIVTSMEAGMGESNDTGSSVDTTLSIQIAALAKAATSIPIVISCGVVTNPPDLSAFASSAADMLTFNYFGQNGTGIQALIDQLTGALATSGTKPVAVTSYALAGSNYTTKNDYYANCHAAWFGHPDIQGLISWGGQGISPDGDFSLYNVPANTFDPTSDWTDTVVSTQYAAHGALNRNLNYIVTQVGTPTISNTAAAIPLTIHVPFNVGTPTVDNIALRSYFKQVCNLSLTGTISLSGDPSSQYTISFIATNTDTSVATTIGTPLVLTGSPSGQAINMTGVLPAAAHNFTFTIQGQRTSGSVNATVTALSATVSIGNAPALPTPPAVSLGNGFARLASPKTFVAMAGLGLLKRNPIVTRRKLLKW